MDGKAVRSRTEARKALANAKTGDAALRKRSLEELRRLGLVDVATDYALLLLLFAGRPDLEWAEGGEALVGVEEAVVLGWRQKSGGVLEFLDGKQAVRPMHGFVWARKSDGAPLRIRAATGHTAKGRVIRDEASVEYVLSKQVGCATPVSAAHRHLVDGVMLTENLYTYEPFRLFTTDTRIEYKDR
jgi:hypothetical protein